MDEPVRLVDPDPGWPRRYAAEAARIAAALAGSDATVEHVGSTAVPLRGKPIVDVQVGVPAARRAAAVAAIAGLGYRRHGEAGVPGREYLTLRPPAGDPVNVHVFAAGDARLEDNRRLVAHLRRDPQAARAYVAAKEAALRTAADLVGYSAAKADAVSALLRAARGR